MYLFFFIANFIKVKFVIKTKETKDNVVKEEPVKIIDVKDTVFKVVKGEFIKELSNSWTALNRRLMRFMKR